MTKNPEPASEQWQVWTYVVGGDNKYPNTFTEDPNRNATQPTGMCGSTAKCGRCPSTFLCWVKAKAEKEIIDAR